MKTKQFLLLTAFITLLLPMTYVTVKTLPAQAAVQTYNVDSTADDSDDNLGDEICATATNECTLRAAIEESNASVGDKDTINFALTGASDFTNQGQDGYSIELQSTLPGIVDSVVIDGYSQNGSSVNTAASPNPINSVLLVEIDGSNLVTSNSIFAPCFDINGAGASGTEIHGLVINRCGSHGIFAADVDDLKIQGNYIGTDYTGLIDQGNGRDYTVSSIAEGIFFGAVQDSLIGGTNASDRNIISGNQAGEIFIGDETDLDQSRGNIIQGNYVGIGADGLTPLPSGYNFGLGNAILLGHSSDDLIGGTSPGATNVIGSSLEFGVSFRDGCADSSVEGNYIGTDYTGNATTPYTFTNTQGTFEGTGHIGGGVHIAIVSNGGFTRPSHDINVGGTTPGSGNVISGNEYSNSLFDTPGLIVHDGAYNVLIQGNHIGVGLDGTTPLPNEGHGISVADDYAGSGVFDVLIGGTDLNAGNIISHNGKYGIRFDVDDGNPGAQNVSILGNSISDNSSLGISIDPSGSPHINDSGDADTGSNTLLNMPVLTYRISGGQAMFDYSLDVPAGTYRVDFFTSTTPDGSGYGEGETYLGSDDDVVSNGSGVENFTHVITTGATENFTAIVTEKNDSNFFDFGPSSEFSEIAEEQPPGVSDIGIALEPKTVPSDVSQGGTITYSTTLTNYGPADLDLSLVSGSTPGVDNLMMFIIPPELTFNSSLGSDVSCTSAGPGSASLFGTALGNHSDWEIVLCTYTGSDDYLEVGDSLEFDIVFDVLEDSDLIFDIYATNTVSANSDPDGIVIGEVFVSGEDLIDNADAMNINSFVRASFPPPDDPDETDDGPTENGVTITGSLPTTGLGLSAFMAGLILIVSGLISRRASRIHFKAARD